jgi:Tol biopolymer transport system component
VHENPDVVAWFERTEHPLKEVMLAVREAILSADERMTESIKWQAPTFEHKGNLPETEYRPTWSRDGTRLAFWSGREDVPGELVVVDADGDDAVTVAETSQPLPGGWPFSGVSDRWFPASLLWSADGTEIMYDTCTCDEDDAACGVRLFIASTDGSGSRPAGDPGLHAQGPTLSPDGSRVAFGGGAALPSEALYLMDWDGSDIAHLDTGIPGGDLDIWVFSGQSWSADGSRIVTHNGGTIWVVELDATGMLQTVERMGSGFFPAYAPAGGEIMDFFGKIYAADDQSGLASTDLRTFRLQWSPDATQLVGVRGEDLVVLDRDTGDATVIGVADDSNAASWQRIAP